MIKSALWLIIIRWIFICKLSVDHRKNWHKLIFECLFFVFTFIMHRISKYAWSDEIQKKNLNFEHLWWLKYSKGCCFYYDYLFCNFHDENSWFMKWTMDSVSPLFLWSILVNSRENSLSSYFSSIDPNVLERSLASAAIYIALNP